MPKVQKKEPTLSLPPRLPNGAYDLEALVIELRGRYPEILPPRGLGENRRKRQDNQKPDYQVA